ncbi:MAG: hypothetical protein FJ088_13955 [Deltaproteobacteria bacterium]|nr:hypothetical protein [Deltaproteobacteria bacterium]
MTQKLMQEAIDKVDFERMEKGLPPRPIIKPKLVVPDPPIIENQVRLKEISLKQVTDLAAKSKTIRNPEGFRFIGFDVMIGIKDKDPISGWMSEADFYQLRREVGGRIDTSKVEF